MKNYVLPPGKVLVLKSAEADMTAYGGFVWPKEGPVSAPDWQATTECGNGLHGWLWGVGDFSLKVKGSDAVWLAIEVDADKIVNLNGKVKFPSGVVLFAGSYVDAYLKVRGCCPDKPESITTGHSGHAAATGDSGHAAATGHSGHAAATGHSGHAAATGKYGHAAATGKYGHAAATGDSGHAAATGYSGHAAATGDSGHAAATGDYGHAAATGYSGHAAATGDSGHAAATGHSGHAAATGDYGHAAATGDYGHAAVLGYSGTGQAGPNGYLALTWYDGKRGRLSVGYVGEDLKAGVTYKLDDQGRFVEVT